MKTAPEIAVTLSASLLRRLKEEARLLGVSLEWLVASLVVDTIDEDSTGVRAAVA